MAVQKREKVQVQELQVFRESSVSFRARSVSISVVSSVQVRCRVSVTVQGVMYGGLSNGGGVWVKW